MNDSVLINPDSALINPAFFTRVHSTLFLPCLQPRPSLSLSFSSARLSPHSEFRRGERKRPPLTIIKGEELVAREGTASAVFAPDKSTSRSASEDVVICVYIYARAHLRGRLACAFLTVQERGYRPSRPFPRVRRA